MDSKINFTLVGVFLFVFILGLIGFSFWLGKYGMDSKKVDLYTVYLEESISGLNIESSIKYKGLNIGVVKNIKINPNNSEQIEILIEVDGGTPIKKDTLAVLEAQGITGLKYIDLIGGSNKSALLKTNNNEIAIIKSKQSFFGSLGDSAQDITKKVNIVLNRLDLLFSKNNIEQISTILNNTNSLTKNLDTTVANVNTKINKIASDNNIQNIDDIFTTLKTSTKQLNTAMSDIAQFSTQLNKTLQTTDTLITNDLKQTLTKVSKASDSTTKAFDKFAKLIQDGQFDLKDMTDDSLKKFDILMIELERTMQNIQKTVDDLSDSPSDIIFKSSDTNLGPGEHNE